MYTWIGVQPTATRLTELYKSNVHFLHISGSGGANPPAVITFSGDGYRTTPP